MKPFVPRLIGWGIAAVMAAVCVLQNFSTENLIVMAVLLGLLALVVFVRKDKTMTGAAPAIAGGWIFFGLLVPEIRPEYYQIMDGMEQLFESFGEALGDTTLGLSLAALVILFFVSRKINKKDPLLLILLRYGALSGALLGWNDYMDGGDGLLVPVLLLILVMNLTYELRTRHGGARVGRTISCLLAGVCCLGVRCVFGNMGAELLVDLLGLEAGNLYVVLGVAALGGLLVAEEYALGSVSVFGMTKEQKDAWQIRLDSFLHLGGVLLCWSVVALIMLLWPGTHDPIVLLGSPFVLYYWYAAFMDRWMEYYGRAKKKQMFFTVWPAVGVAMLAMGRSVNAGNGLVIPVLVLLTIAAAVCWTLSRKKRKEKNVMVAFLGVAAAVLLGAASGVQPQDMGAMTGLTLTVAVMSVFWCVLCGTVYKLDLGASKADENEFSKLEQALPYVSLVAIALAALKLLLG